MNWLLVGYMFLFIHRPFEIITILADVHLERVYLIATLLYFVAAGSKRWLPNYQHVAIFGFSFAVVVCWLASPWNAAGEAIVDYYLKLVVFYALIVVAVHSEKDLRFLVLGFLGVMTVYMLHSLREYLGGHYVYRMGIARMVGVDVTMSDPNSFGATIVYALPLVLAFWRSTTDRRLKLFLAGYTLLSIVCISLTGSRSSFLGLVVLIGVVTAFHPYRFRVAAAVLPLCFVGFLLLPESMQNRFITIVDPSVGPANAQESAESRWDGLYLGAELFNRSPLTGCGPGAWRPATGAKIESHNLYGQVLGETGALGSSFFLAMLLGYIINYRAISRHYRSHPDEPPDFLLYLSQSVLLGVLMMLVLGFFGHNMFRYNWLWYAGFLIIARSCLERRSVPEYYARPVPGRRFAMGHGAFGGAGIPACRTFER